MRDEQNRQGSTEVIIDGNVIPLSGGDSAYLRQVAAYIDNKIAELRQNRAYARQNSERRAQILWLNLADDCLQARAESAELKEEAAAHAAEVYSLKRELVEQRLRMEGPKKDGKADAAETVSVEEKQKTEAALAESERKNAELEAEISNLEAEKTSLEAINAGLEAEKERLEERVRELEEALAAEKQRSQNLESELDDLLAK